MRGNLLASDAPYIHNELRGIDLSRDSKYLMTSLARVSEGRRREEDVEW